MREIKFIYTIVRENGFVFNSESMTLEDIELKLAANFLTNNIVRTCDKIHRRQFTGLKDRNGKQIYEGDIVNGTTTRFTPSSYSGSNPLAREFSGVVEYQTAGFIVRLNNQKHIDKLGGKSVLHFSVMDEYEIIGNIYENPELLK